MNFNWTDELKAELANLWHLSAIATALPIKERLFSYPPGNNIYRRQLWTSETFNKDHTACSPTAAYKELDRQRSWRY